MTPQESFVDSERAFVHRVTAAAIQLCVLGAWVGLCVHFVLPFFFPVLWGAIIATAVHPLLRLLFPDRPKRGAAMFLMLSLTIVLIPSWFLIKSAMEALSHIGDQLARGELKIPEPDPRVAEWPLIGDRVFNLWKEAIETPRELSVRMAPQIRSVGRWLLESVGHMVSALGLSIVSLFLATGFLIRAPECSGGLTTVTERLLPGRGAGYIELAGATVRSVAQGVLGVAFLQAMLAAIGLVAAQVPGAGLWTAVVLVLAVMQLPPLLVLGPAAFHVFGAQGNVTGVLFLVWSLMVSASDGILKPFLLARGVNVPTLVILLGAIGGMLTSGIIGLFVGAVVLAVAYELGRAWLRDGDGTTQASTSLTDHVDESTTPTHPGSGEAAGTTPWSHAE